jgi:hypothetical protein
MMIAVRIVDRDRDGGGRVAHGRVVTRAASRTGVP